MTRHITAVIASGWRRMAEWFAHGQLRTACTTTCRV